MVTTSKQMLNLCLITWPATEGQGTHLITCLSEAIKNRTCLIASYTPLVYTMQSGK